MYRQNLNHGQDTRAEPKREGHRNQTEHSEGQDASAHGDARVFIRRQHFQPCFQPCFQQFHFFVSGATNPMLTLATRVAPDVGRPEYTVCQPTSAHANEAPSGASIPQDRHDQVGAGHRVAPVLQHLGKKETTALRTFWTNADKQSIRAKCALGAARKAAAFLASL